MNTSIQGSSDSQPSFSWPRRLAIAACLIVGCVFSFRAMTPDVAAKVTSETSQRAELQGSVDLTVPVHADVKLVTKNIEDIQLGQRVVGRNPLRHETQAPSEIDPATWRAVRLSMIQNGVEYDLAFLRPLSWLKSTGAVVGGSIHMELQEMGLNGPARVVGIDPCPTIEPDNGTGHNVVTGTMAHPGANIVYLAITGLDEPLGVTDTHPIWSETRQDFVVAGQLKVGEQFRTVTGQSATLTKIHPHRGPPEMVFNLEVDGQHVYHVATSGLLVHNNCPVSLYHGTNLAGSQSLKANGILPVGLDDGAFHVTDRLADVSKWGEEIVEIQAPSAVVHDLFQSGKIVQIPHIPNGFKVLPEAFTSLSQYIVR
jgi:hypothetical protein